MVLETAVACWVQFAPDNLTADKTQFMKLANVKYLGKFELLLFEDATGSDER